MSSHRTITIVGTPTVKEGLVSGAGILPGFLVERSSVDGDFRAHSTASGPAAKCFALEDEHQGKEISEVYSDNARIFVGFFRSGDEVSALLYQGQTAVIGSKLKSSGNGYLSVDAGHASNSDGGFDEGGETVYSDIIVGTSLEALDLSDSSEADPASQRLRIEID